MILFVFLAALIMLCSCGRPDAGTSVSVDTDSVEIASVDNDSTRPITEAKAAERPLTLAFAGDIMMGTTYPEDANYLPPKDGAELFRDVTAVLSSADIAAANLEGTFLDGEGLLKTCDDPELCYAFRMPTRYADHLVKAGFDVVGLANNHVNDFGPPGLRSTKATLEKADIKYAGLRDGARYSIFEKDGRKIGFTSFGHSKGTLSIMNLDEVKSTVRTLRDSCNFVIVSFHGGGEGKSYNHVPHKMETCFGENRGDVEKFAHTAVDAGADVVFGHGPHVTRALELYKHRLIMYSLGNFCTPYQMSLSGLSGHAPVVTVELNPDGTFSSGKIHSFIQSIGKGPRIDPTNSVARNMKRLSKEDFPSSPLKIDNEGNLSTRPTNS